MGRETIRHSVWTRDGSPLATDHPPCIRLLTSPVLALRYLGVSFRDSWVFLGHHTLGVSVLGSTVLGVPILGLHPHSSVQTPCHASGPTDLALLILLSPPPPPVSPPSPVSPLPLSPLVRPPHVKSYTCVPPWSRANRYHSRSGPSESRRPSEESFRSLTDSDVQ